MAYTSNSLGSDTDVQSCSKNYVKTYEKLQKQFDEQRQTLSKANLDIIAYQLGLESVEAQLVVHQKNEDVYKENIAVLEFEVKDKKMSRVESVRPSGVIIEDWVSDDDEDIFQSNDLQATDKPSFKRIEFTNARNESVKPKQAKKPRTITQNPKVDRRDWNGKMTQKLALGFGFTKKAYFVCGSYSHLIKDSDFHEKRMAKKSVLKNMGKNSGQREIRPVWNNTQRINHQNKFVPSAVLTRSGRVPVSAAKQSSFRAAESTSAVKQVNTATHTNRVNVSKLRTNAFQKSNSPIRREMNEFCGLKRIKREFSVARTPQQNGVAERKNKTLIEAARTMLADSLLPTVFWAEAVNTACYVLNRVLVTKPHNKTPYELIIGRPPSISFMRPFGCLVTILNTLDPLGKFDGKAEEGFLVGYSINSKAFRVFNSQKNQKITAGNQTNKNASPQEANDDTGLKKSVDDRLSEEKNVSTQQYDCVSHYDGLLSLQAIRAQMNRIKMIQMMDQEKEAKEQSDTVRKEFEAQCNRQNLSGRTTKASSTNSFNTVSTPVNAAVHQELLMMLDHHLFLLVESFLDESSHSLNIFQIKQSERGISINQEKYVKDLLKKYDINGSSVKIPMVPPNNLGPDLNGKAINETQYRGIDLKGYLDFDYAGCNMDKKSTSAEAEYVAAAGCCANILWMKSQLTNYDIIYEKVPIFCDNTNHIMKGNIELHFIPTQYQLADIFNKPLDEPTFKRLIIELDQGTPIPYDLVPQVDYESSQIHFKDNNEVALIYPEHPNKEHFKIVDDFVSKCCLREAFIRTLTQYKEYLTKFWYIAFVVEKSNRVWFSIPSEGIKGEVGVTSSRNVIGENYLAHSRNYKAIPSIETIREWFPTIGYSGTIKAKGTLKRLSFLLDEGL
ncbi:retrovirus-related pol polyprotein from transposon TNT 1-94 [Tanacetum coccineum]|uniref:Retrovirus-related pol polyprotein from transposon TNT 1-94 n=1 Tax=Tanacetum coccineum TaxID=301880 RepID=A0ABQ5D3L6_9ASTR